MSVCSLLCGEGPRPRSGGAYPIPGLARGVHHPRSGRGVPHPRSGWGDKVRMGYPPRTWDRVPPRPGQNGVPPDLGWGTPWTWDGVPPWTWDKVTPKHSEHLLRSGQYASCVHGEILIFHRVHILDFQMLSTETRNQG